MEALRIGKVAAMIGLIYMSRTLIGGQCGKLAWIQHRMFDIRCDSEVRHDEGHATGLRDVRIRASCLRFQGKP
jgi:hypothetical protein